MSDKGKPPAAAKADIRCALEAPASAGTVSWCSTVQPRADTGAVLLFAGRSFFAKPAGTKPAAEGAAGTAATSMPPPVAKAPPAAPPAAPAAAATQKSPKPHAKATPAKRAAAQEPEVVVVDDSDDEDAPKKAATKRPRATPGVSLHLLATGEKYPDHDLFVASKQRRRPHRRQRSARARQRRPAIPSRPRRFPRKRIHGRSAYSPQACAQCTR